MNEKEASKAEEDKDAYQFSPIVREMFNKLSVSPVAESDDDSLEDNNDIDENDFHFSCKNTSYTNPQIRVVVPWQKRNVRP